MQDKVKRSGGCACGNVRYQGDGEWLEPTACHCGQCRKQTGSFYMTTGIAKKDFQLLEDKGLRWYKASEHAERGFCQFCGTMLFWHSIDENWVPTERIGIGMGSLDDTQGLHVKKHIFTENIGDYYSIDNQT